MAWEDRSYNRGSGGGGGEFLGNPATFLSWSVPLGTWFGANVRLHFWLILTIVFAYMRGNIAIAPLATTFSCAIVIACLLLHEFCHKWAAEAIGGTHDQFLLWPAGGLLQPNVPPVPWPLLAANGAGVLGSLILAIVAYIGLLYYHQAPFPPIGVGSILWSLNIRVFDYSNPIAFVCNVVYYFNAGLVLINLTPFYIFDGGYLWEAALTNWLGRFRAVNVTCIAGMILAVPYFLFSLFIVDFLGMVFWALLFASAYTKRRELVGSGDNEFESAIAMSARDRGSEAGPGGKKARWPSKRAVAKAARTAAAERKEQEQIDEILAKVHAQGMNSLNWTERRALKQATERQRRRAGR